MENGFSLVLLRFDKQIIRKASEIIKSIGVAPRPWI